MLVNSLGSNTNVSYTVYHPVITAVTPPSAAIGGTVVISGTGFGQIQWTSQVKFNGVVANVVGPWSDTSITVVQVPTGATSGALTVTVGGVQSASTPFTIGNPLSVSSISPNIGPAGTVITINGTGFGAQQSNSSVAFNGVAPSSIQSWSDTQIKVVTPSYAASGPVIVGVANMFWEGPSFSPTSTLQLKDSKGNQTSYTSILQGGQWRPLQVQGSGCSSCTARGNISYTYDTNGNALSRTDENGNATTYTYDSNGNALTMTVPISSGHTATTTYTYNTLGEVLTVTDPLGDVTTNTYDTKGDLLSVTTPAPGNGSSASMTQFAYNTLGQLTTITDPLNNATTIAYTPAGLINTITDAQSNVTTYGYDSNGNRTTVKDALNNTTTFTYDAMNRLTKITYPDTTFTQFGYDYRGRRTTVTDQNNKTTTYAYDDADRLLTVTDAATPGNVTTYGYDTESNLTSIKDANNNSTTFDYDVFGRVTTTHFPSGKIETYGYDNVGNLTSKTDRKNQLITYTYDQLNRLTKKTYPDTTTVNYTYDNDSRRSSIRPELTRLRSTTWGGYRGPRRSTLSLPGAASRPATVTTRHRTAPVSPIQRTARRLMSMTP